MHAATAALHAKQQQGTTDQHVSQCGWWRFCHAGGTGSGAAAETETEAESEKCKSGPPCGMHDSQGREHLPSISLQAQHAPCRPACSPAKRHAEASTCLGLPDIDTARDGDSRSGLALAAACWTWRVGVPRTSLAKDTPLRWLAAAMAFSTAGGSLGGPCVFA